MSKFKFIHPNFQIEEYMAQLPNHKVPRVGTSGEKYREKQLMLQLPRQDLAAAYCKHLASGQEQAAFEDFVAARNENSLDIGYVVSSLDKNTVGALSKNFLVITVVQIMFQLEVLVYRLSFCKNTSSHV